MSTTTTTTTQTTLEVTLLDYCHLHPSWTMQHRTTLHGT
jgi:hypothetical protein